VWDGVSASITDMEHNIHAMTPGSFKFFPHLSEKRNSASVWPRDDERDKELENSGRGRRRAQVLEGLRHAYYQEGTLAAPHPNRAPGTSFPPTTRECGMIVSQIRGWIYCWKALAWVIRRQGRADVGASGDPPPSSRFTSERLCQNHPSVPIRNCQISTIGMGANFEHDIGGTWPRAEVTEGHDPVHRNRSPAVMGSCRGCRRLGLAF